MTALQIVKGPRTLAPTSASELDITKTLDDIFEEIVASWQQRLREATQG